MNERRSDEESRIEPGYNLQVAWSHQYVIDYDIFPNPTDTRTLIPVLDFIQTLDLFNYIVANASYGSEENYQTIIGKFEKVPLIPYGMYYKEKSKKYKSNLKYRDNWEFFKHKAQENLKSESEKEFYAQRKIDIKTVFGRMKGVFGMRSVHVRGKQAVHNDIGIMLMSMNLTKLAIEARRKAKAFQHFSAQKKYHSKTIRYLIEFTVIFLFRAGYLPAPFYYHSLG